MKLLLLITTLIAMMQIIQVEALFGLLALKAGVVGFALGRGFGGRRGRGFGGRRGFGRGRGFGRRGGFRRFGRDLSAVSDEVTDQEQDQELQDLQLDSFFEVVQEQDADGCSLKLVCELHTMDPDQLGEEENIILALFGTDVPQTHRPNSARMVYEAAAELGRKTTLEVCAETFTNCRYNAHELLKVITTSSQQ